MRASVILTLLMVGGLTFASVPATDLAAGQQVKLYYGLPGSNDFVLGTVGPNTPADAWALHSNMPGMLMDNAAAANETHVYVVSGYRTGNPRELFRCPIGGTTWETLTAPPQEICNGGAAILGDTLYYCSGYTYATDAATVDTLWKYSISGDNWTSAPGPYTGTTYNWQPFVLACMGKVYYISGCNQPGAVNPTTQVWAYEPGSGWSQVANMNQGRVFAAGWVYNDTIWMAGGNVNNVATNHTEFYDPVANVWTVDNGLFPTLPYAVWGPGSGISGNTAFVAGGVPASGLVDSIMYFDYSSRTWSIDEPLHTRVYRTAGVGTANGYAWLCGGSTGGFTPTNIVQYEVLASGNATDVGVNAIVCPTGAVPPGPTGVIARIKNFGTDPQSDIPVVAMIDSAGSNVYSETETYAGPLAPGATAEVTFPNWSAVNGTYDVTMYTEMVGDENRSNDTMMGAVNVIASAWEPIPAPSSTPDRIVHATIWDPGTDQVFIIGGNPAGATGTYDGKCQAYDPNAMGWTVKAPMPTPLGWCGYGQVGDKIYMIGGHNNTGGFVGTNQEYDIASNTWSTKAARPGTAVAAPLSATWNDSLIYIMGGLATSAERRVDIYDPASNSWMVGTQLPLGAYMGSAVCVGDTIFAVNAYSGTCWPNLYKGYIDPANPASINWIMGPANPTPVFNGATVAVGNDIYWIGGFQNATTVTNQVWKYSGGAITRFSPDYLISLARCTYAAVRENVDGDEIYVMGGDMNGDWSAPNQTYAMINFGGTGVEEERPVVLRSTIDAVSPSVVRDVARISYTIGQTGNVRLGVYDVTGKLVRSLVDGTVTPGTRTSVWDRTDGNGRQVANGTYFYRLTVDGRSVSAKSVVLD